METADDDDGMFVVIVQDAESEKSESNRPTNSQVCNKTVKRSKSKTNIKETSSRPKKPKVVTNVKRAIIGSDDSDATCVDEEAPDELPSDGKVRKRRKRSDSQQTDRFSLVKGMCEQYPELAQDEELLVETLSGLMKQVTCPEPPEYFCFEDLQNKFVCVVCGDKKATKLASARHWQHNHGPRYLICFACGFKYRDPSYLYKHETQCTNEYALIVLKAREKLCGRSNSGFRKKYHSIPFADKNKKSIVNQLREENPELHNRELMINKLAELMSQKSPPPLPKDSFDKINDDYKCNTCGVTKDTIGAISRHWQCLHGPRYLSCLVCGWTFRDYTNLYKHEKRCTAPDADLILQARALIITSKRRARPRKNNTYHLQTQSRQTPQVPLEQMNKKEAKTTLPKREKKKGVLTKDKKGDKTTFPKKVQKTGVLNCSYCPATYRDSVRLQAHERAHTGARPYACPLCPAAYTSAQGLYRHRSTHEVQFICDHCGRVLNSRACLISHLNSHLPERKHACGECGRRYAQKMALRIHIDRDHRHLPPPCACQLCPKRYPKMSLLKVHMREKHGMLLMTRNMYFRQLPHLSESELAQAIVMVEAANVNSDGSPTNKAVEIEISETPTNTDKETSSPLSRRILQKYDNVKPSVSVVPLESNETPTPEQTVVCTQADNENEYDTSEIYVPECTVDVQYEEEVEYKYDTSENDVPASDGVPECSVEVQYEEEVEYKYDTSENDVPDASRGDDVQQDNAVVKYKYNTSESDVQNTTENLQYDVEVTIPGTSVRSKDTEEETKVVKHGGCNDRTTKTSPFVIIKDGKAVFYDGNNVEIFNKPKDIDHYKQKIIKNNNLDSEKIKLQKNKEKYKNKGIVKKSSKLQANNKTFKKSHQIGSFDYKHVSTISSKKKIKKDRR